VTEPLCQACARPSDAFLCRNCGDKLTRALGHVPDLVAELEVTVARLAHTGGASIGVISPSTEQALPFHWEAANVAWDLANVLGTWARLTAEHVGAELHLEAERVPPPRVDPSAAIVQAPRDTASRASRWLLRYVMTIRLHPAGGQALEEITDAIKAVWRVIDKPPERAYVGPCGAELDDGAHCTQDLYGRPEWATVRCPACDAEWDMAERRDWLLRQLEGYLLTATEMSRALPTWLGVQVTADMIRGYGFRHKIRQYAAHPWDARQAPRYRVGDVLDVLESIEERAS
jgi:hypothetical protein